MKPKLMLTIAGVYYSLDGLAGFFMVSGLDFIAWRIAFSACRLARCS